MRIVAGREFSTWLAGIQAIQGPTRTWAMSLLAHLPDLEEKPTVDSATLKRVRQAKRYEVWRLAHPFDPAAAVRILCWFPDR